MTPRLAIHALVFILFLSAPAAAEGPRYTLTTGTEVTPLERFQECKVCPEMVALPLGRFILGSPPEESADWEDYLFRNTNLSDRKEGAPPGWAREGPVHEVEVDIPFAMARNEVTFDDWMACVSDGGCSRVPDDRVVWDWETYTPRGTHPVRVVSILDIQEYAAWLNGKVGADVYRLPTEAEWVFAARAGTTAAFIHGDSLPPGIANVGISVIDETGEHITDKNHVKLPVPVEEMADENAWGLRHLSGNVSERTLTCFSERHLGLKTTSAYLAHALSQPDCVRVVKGSSYRFNHFNSRISFRGRATMTGGALGGGFRLVRELQ